MKKLLIMASLFYPQKNGGGPPVSIMNVIQAIRNEFEIFVITHVLALDFLMNPMNNK